MGIAQVISNRVMTDVQNIPDTGLPITVFPEKLQQIILEMVRYEDYKVEFLVAAMLSATSAALGGAYHIRVKGQWTTNAALYIILVGKPGLGKTPPLESAFRPIRRHDCAQLEKFKADMDAYRNAIKESKGESGLDKPTLARIIVSDFTPEALIQAHNNNPRGIAILVDEIMGMFNSANRYNSGQLIEQLLTAWSGGALDVVRAGNPIPIHIEQPCINMIGTTQTKRMRELFKKGYEENGLLDRILFVLPGSQELSLWTASEDNSVHEKSANAFGAWQGIMDKVLALDYASGDDGTKPVSYLIDMEPEARNLFITWHNHTIKQTNAITDELLIESRPMKGPAHVARMALLLQVLGFACGESHLQSVTKSSVEGAIKLFDFFEDSYHRIREFVSTDACDEPTKELLDMLNDSFTTTDALAAGKQMCISERTVMNYLRELQANRLVRKIRKGEYRKVYAEGCAESDSNTDTENPNCNI